MNPQLLTPQDPVELEALVQQGMDGNEKLSSIDVNTEAQVVKQLETIEAIKDLEAPLEANALMTSQLKPVLEEIARNTASRAQEGIRLLKGEEEVTDDERAQFVTDLLRGKPGRAGKDGKDGKDGKPGRDGIDGRDGSVGPQGPQGEQGLPGPMGPMGPMGLPGNDGADGRDGRDGKDGKDGKAAPVKEIIQEVTKYVDKEAERIGRHVASKTYSVFQIEDITIAATAPSNPQLNALWVDLS
jgi:hypothetical protein